MPREFYTEDDIEDMYKRGERSLTVHDGVTLTALAYEKARQIGLTLVQASEKNPATPVRPYLSQITTGNADQAETKPCNCQNTCQNPKPVITAEVKERIRSAVLNRLGSQVDAEMLDRIIDRVLSSTGVK